MGRLFGTISRFCPKPNALQSHIFSDILSFNKGVVGTTCDDINILEYILVSSEMTRLICYGQIGTRFLFLEVTRSNRKIGGIGMADSNITKRALAAALKELMKDIPFAKITISNISDACGMSRKSFYYHFKDKYDLINWIFESEYIIPLKSRMEQKYRSADIECFVADERWALANDMCRYFYENRSFYSKVLQIKDQNCFSDYFRDLLRPILSAHISTLSSDQSVIHFGTELCLDASILALERWIMQKDAMPPEEFTRLLRAYINILPNLTEFVPNI